MRAAGNERGRRGDRTAGHLFRRMARQDIKEVFAVRDGARDNPFTVGALAAAGITPGALSESLGKAQDGWLCHSEGRVVGFAMSNLKSGEMWVIAVRPGYERRGIARELLRLAEESLWAAGHDSIWLRTNPDRGARAFRLYKNSGWTETRVRDGRLFMGKDRPRGTAPSRAGARRSGPKASLP
jgi:ribosomal protein S18 acetylase RimI-like enzyme